MTIKPHTGEARPMPDHRFEFCCFADFAGHQEERPTLDPQPVNANRWEHLFEQFKPQCTIWLNFQGVDDFKLDIPFRQLRDFRPKGLCQRVNILTELKALANQIEAASESAPLVPSKCQGNTMAWLRSLAAQTADEGFVDLLSMVDLGDDNESGLYLKYLKSFLNQSQYLGMDRAKVLGDLKTVEKQILEQIRKNTRFRQLEATWRGLHASLTAFGANVKLNAVDCAREELCDALFLNFVKPENGEPLALDLAFTIYELDHHGPSLHLLHHLGHMASHLSVPFLFNAAPELLGAKGYNHLSHITDISGKFNGVAHTKWRKLRDEPGAEWLFAALNPWRVDDGSDEHAVWAVPAFFVAGLIARRLAAGKWPGELLGASGIWDLSQQTAASLSDGQAIDYAYEGIGVLGGKSLGNALMGMNMLADVKLTGPESLEAANFVDYTLPYRFFVGCASRYFLTQYLAHRDSQAFAEFLGLKCSESLDFEETDGQLICRFQAPFTIYSTHADMVIGAQLDRT